MPGICQAYNYARHMPVILYAGRHMPGIKYSGRHMPGIFSLHTKSLKYARHMPVHMAYALPCQAYAWHMCPKYSQLYPCPPGGGLAWHMPGICLEYAWHILGFLAHPRGPQYAKHMPGILRARCVPPKPLPICPAYARHIWWSTLVGGWVCVTHNMPGICLAYSRI